MENQEYDILENRATQLFTVLGAFFVANALIAEFIGIKIFSLEETWGLSPFNFSLFGQEGLAFNLTVGVLLWPFVFIMTDVINEYFGKRAVKFLSYLTVALIMYAFFMLYFGMILPAPDWWVVSKVDQGIPDMNLAFNGIFGQGMWIIIGSMTAFLIGQLLDVMVFQFFKRKTGEKGVWLRATGSTLISQFIDSFVVLFIGFYIGAGWSFQLVLAIGLVWNYAYKFFCAIALTPLIYLAHYLIDSYLGYPLAQQLKNKALAP